jgi:hypothetical protein
MEQTNSNNINKKVFENLENKGKGFEEESEEFAGDDIEV